jgi:signal transduction histidine kinase
MLDGMAWSRTTAWLVSVPAIAVALGTAVVVGIAGSRWDQLRMIVSLVVVGGSVCIGLLVATRRPRNVVAPLLCAMALLWAVSEFADLYPLAAVREPALIPQLPPLAGAVLSVSWIWMYVAFALVALVFPGGETLGPRWRVVGASLIVGALGIQLTMMVTAGPYAHPFEAVPHPFGDLPHSVSFPLRAVLFTAVVALSFAALASPWIRFRRGDAVRRAQLKWFVLAGIALPLTAMLSWLGYWILGTHRLTGVGLAILYLAVPVATAIAVLRHNLYDVERVLSGTVTWGLVTTGLLVVYTVVAFSGGLLLGSQTASGAAAAAATCTAAVVLMPVRRGLQRRLDRRLYPRRRAALEAIDSIHTATTAGEAAPERIQDALRTALRDPGLRIGYVLPGTDEIVDIDGEPLPAAITTSAVVFMGRQVGVLATDSDLSRPLLSDVAAAAALLVEMVRLRLTVTHALREAESSRGRLLSTGYAERRRLERDLHDGAQQRLVSLGMTLRLAQRRIPTGTVDVDGLLDQAVADIGTAIAELRQVANGLRPSSLDEGLLPAISQLTRVLAIPVALEARIGQHLPDAVATTAYYVIGEAVTNAMKHANATRLDLRLVTEADLLRLEVEDNGVGGAITRPGSGLAGIKDRVAAAGGSLSIHNRRDRGTIIKAVLPCES